MRPFGERWRAPYACDPWESRGRLYPEPASPTRSEFQRDRDRIIHSSAFRRLKHKTQVFVYHEGDHFRTRLTHTIEVSQIARALARSLGLDEDLAEALALVHDLGHTPFGHTGEDALDDCMAAFGGFDHNAQALRIVTRLERRYAISTGSTSPGRRWRAWSSTTARCSTRDGSRRSRYAERGVPLRDPRIQRAAGPRLATYASGEAQAAAIADDIAYNAHDIDDGLRAGLFGIEDLRERAVRWRAAAMRSTRRYPGLERRGDPRAGAAGHHPLRRGRDARRANGGWRRSAPASADAIRMPRAHGRRVLDGDGGGGRADQGVPLSRTCTATRSDARAAAGRSHRARPLRALHGRARGACRRSGARPARATTRPRCARRVADYIAGMTDRYASRTPAPV